MDITACYLYTDLHDPNYASWDEPRNEDEDSSMPSLHLYCIEYDSELDDESDLESAIDVTQMYRYGELENEWSETMEVEIMEEGAMDKWNIHYMLAGQMGTYFSLANPQQAFLGSMELLKSSDIWIGDTRATNHTTFSKEGAKNVK